MKRAEIIINGCPQISLTLTSTDGFNIKVSAWTSETGSASYPTDPANGFREWDGFYTPKTLPIEIYELGSKALLEGRYNSGPHSNQFDFYFAKLFLLGGNNTNFHNRDWKKVRRRIEDRLRKEFVPEFLLGIALKVGGIKFSE